MPSSKRSRTEGRDPVAALPARARPRAAAAGWLPTGRSVLLGLALALAAIALYLVARETSLFALRTIAVSGAPPQLAARVRAALEPLAGSSLVAFDAGAAEGRLGTLPEVASATFDRDFPHTLRVAVEVERPVAILRRGPEAWLLSARARVLRELSRRPYPRLPRVWAPPESDVIVGATLAGQVGAAARAAALLAETRFPGDVRLVRGRPGQLTLVLGSGRELRLGDAAGLAVKLAVARRLLPLAAGAAYVDVSVPERSVAGYVHRVSG